MGINYHKRDEMSLFCGSLFSTLRRDQPRVPIDRDTLSTTQALGCHTCAEDGGNVILAGHNRTVAERATYVGNDPSGQGKEWRPGGRRDPRHQDITRSHLVELVGAMNDPRQASDTPR